jgi:CRP/FNR family transcriptional regulator
MAERASVEDVRAISYFRALDDVAAERLAREMVCTRYTPRERIITEGDPAPGFYFLRAGKARIFRTGADGREQSFRVVAAGDTFGEVPVFDARPNPASVEALSDCEVILIPTAAVIDTIGRHPEVAVPLLVHFARRLRSFTELVEQISLQTVPGRLARYLYQVGREEGVTTEEGVVIARDITQQDLASLVGSVREVVSRSLKVMEDEGIIVIRRKELVIRDMAALREMV